MNAHANPMIATRNVSKRFVKRLDIAGKIAQKFGSGNPAAVSRHSAG